MTLDDLIAYGADVETGLGRCMGNEEFYIRLVGMVKDEKGFDALAGAIGDGDLQAAFEAAHALKGVLGNLALTPAFEPVSQITELLRAETQMDYAPLLETIMAERDRLNAL